MAKLILDIPDELISLVTRRNGSAKKYIEAVLINPLLEQLEYDFKQDLFKTEIKELNQKLKDYRKQFTITTKD